LNSYYDILGIDVSANPEQVKRAFRQRAKEIHPDLHVSRGDAVADMQALIRAYETLIDPDRREEYDRRMMIVRPEFRFDYREYLKGRPEDNEAQSRLVFFDLLHQREEDAVHLYTELRLRRGFALNDHLDREDYMDCAFLLAEEYERREEYLASFDLYLDLIRFELDRAYFKHFFVEVLERVRNLTCFKMPVALPPEQVIECLETLVMLDLPRKDVAFFLKKAAELYADMSDPATATQYLNRGLELDEKLAGTKKLKERLSSFHPV
jgi:tetratricopeptide (TPR) repeat protein